MKLQIDRVLVYNVQFSESEKTELCSELKKIDEEQYPEIVSFYRTLTSGF